VAQRRKKPRLLEPGTIHEVEELGALRMRAGNGTRPTKRRQSDDGPVRELMFDSPLQGRRSDEGVQGQARRGDLAPQEKRMVSPRTPRSPPVDNAWGRKIQAQRALVAQRVKEQADHCRKLMAGLTGGDSVTLGVLDKLLADLTTEIINRGILAVHGHSVSKNHEKWPVMGACNEQFVKAIGWAESLTKAMRERANRALKLILAKPVHQAFKAALPPLVKSLTSPKATREMKRANNKKAEKKKKAAPAVTGASKVPALDAVCVLKEQREVAIRKANLTGDARGEAMDKAQELIACVAGADVTAWGEDIEIQVEEKGHEWTVKFKVGSVVSHMFKVAGQKDSRFCGVIVAMRTDENDDVFLIVEYQLFEVTDFDFSNLVLEEYVDLRWHKNYIVTEDYDILNIQSGFFVTGSDMHNHKKGGMTQAWKVKGKALPLTAPSSAAGVDSE
jgi:hypothetical protein